MALSFKQLCALLDASQPAAVRRLLKERGVRWIPDRKGRPTTSDAEWDRAISAEKRKITFTKPPCRKKVASPRVSAKSTAPGTSSATTSGPSYVG